MLINASKDPAFGGDEEGGSETCNFGTCPAVALGEEGDKFNVCGFGTSLLGGGGSEAAELRDSSLC